MKIVLASKSPRRKLLLDMLGFGYEIVVSSVDESEAKGEISDPFELAKTLARLKAEDVAKGLKGEEAIVIGADTLVSFEGGVIGKAKSPEDAKKVLGDFSGKEHTQITGICIINTMTGKVIVDHDETKLVVRELSDQEIEGYVSTGEPMEGAGCYTPRAHSFLFKEIRGSWTNVVGLPMEKFIPLLGKVMRE